MKQLLQKLRSGTMSHAASQLYEWAASYKNRAYTKHHSLITRVDRKVISIGGIRAGGTGKTPMTLLCSTQLQKLGNSIAILSRGYKRKSSESIIVSPEQPVEWQLIGDEPAMLRTYLPEAWLGIGKNRIQNARTLCSITPKNTVLILDDGFQHRQLGRDLDIVCIHEEVFSDKLLPVGNLREPLSELSRAGMIALICPFDYDETATQQLKEQLHSRFKRPICVLQQSPGKWIELKSGKELDAPPATSPVALSGIARPDRFHNLLISMGIKPCTTRVFSDHHCYKLSDLTGDPELLHHGVVTTEKDAIRLLSLKVELLPDLWYLKIELRFAENESESIFTEIIRNVLST